jgi:hypothetical protein
LIVELNNCSIFRPAEEKDWEKLWYWKFLEDRVYTEILAKVEKEFFEEGNLHFTEVLHISGILLNLIDNELYNRSTKAILLVEQKYCLLLAKSLRMLRMYTCY